jgi:Caspase domain
MSNHWAIIVGINQYQSLQPLSFAQRDAQALQTCLVTEAGFMPERCILLTESSPPVWDHSTYPNREHLNYWIDRLKQDLVQPGDWLWVFFSGYGVCWKGEDYLVPIDADPTALDRTAITLRSVFERLKQLPTDRILMLLDINRSQAIISGERIGGQTATLAKEFGIATILAAQPDQFSQEAPDLGQGLFTAALLESLRFRQASPLENLEQYLSNRIPELSEHHYRPVQHPLISLATTAQLQQATLPPLDSTTEWHGNADDVLVGDAYAEGFVEPTAPPQDPWHVPEPDLAPVGTPHTAIQADNPFGNQPLTNLTSSSDRPSTPPPPTPAGNNDDDMPDPFFWQRFLWGIGVVASVLLFGVLIRQWSNIFGGQPTAQQPNSGQLGELKAPDGNLAIPPNPVNPPDQAKPPAAATGLNVPPAQPKAPDAGAKPPAAKETAPAPAAKAPAAKESVKPAAKAPAKEPAKEPAKPAAKEPAKEPAAKEPAKAATKPAPQPAVAPGDRLAAARALIKPSLASEANRAIALARQIPPNDPQYTEAQREIDRWSQDILNIANQRAAQKNYKQAIAAAQLVPDDRPQLHAVAQKAIAEWKQKR